MRIVIRAHGSAEPTAIDAGAAEVTLEHVYCGVGIKTDDGIYGIAQRDGGIEVMIDGALVWSSSEIDSTALLDAATASPVECPNGSPS